MKFGIHLKSSFRVAASKRIFIILVHGGEISRLVPPMFSNEHCAKCVRSRSFFWSVFSRIRTEYGEILRISPYSVQSGKMWTKNFEYGLFPSSVVNLSLSLYIFSCDKKKNSLKKGKLENIDVNRAKV